MDEKDKEFILINKLYLKGKGEDEINYFSFILSMEGETFKEEFNYSISEAFHYNNISSLSDAKEYYNKNNVKNNVFFYYYLFMKICLEK